MRAITFDVGGTLIEPYPSVGHLYSEVAAHHGLADLSPAELNRRFAEAWLKISKFDYTRATWMALVDHTFAGLAEVPPSRTFFAALYDRFAAPGAWRIFDDVIPTLRALSAQGFKLGIISNWDERLRPLLGRLDLDHFFSDLTISCEVGAIKPDRRIFERAAAKLGCAPSAILHVGDSREADVNGARAAGFSAIELRRHAEAPAESNPAAVAGQLPAFVRSLRELGPGDVPGSQRQRFQI
jgi:putative hydrolase of the HAD superfamily